VIKILHTADWHLGATLQGWSREAEHRKALRQIVDIASEREVDAIIVAGDIFDSLNPSAEAQRLLFDTLKELRAVRPHAVIALIAGNHDPASRIEAPRALFDLIGVHAVGTLARRNGAIDVGLHLAPVYDSAGRIGAHLLLAPYPRDVDLPLATGEIEGSRVVWRARQFYRELISAAREKTGGDPLIVTGHLHVAGAVESEGAERRILVGGEHAVPFDIFPEDVAYVALGHLHRPQSIGRETIRYSGSLFPLSKTEIDYDHGVTIVSIEAAQHAPHRVLVEHAPLARPVPCLRTPSRGALRPGEVEAAFAALNLGELAPDERPFVHLTVTLDGPAAGLKAEIDAIAEKFPIRLVSLAIERPQASDSAPMAPQQRLAERTPLDLFREAFEREHNCAPTDEHLNLFHAAAMEE
jgi:DNA repair protein SbcD/Mre11